MIKSFPSFQEINIYILIYSVSKSSFLAHPWLYGATKPIKTFKPLQLCPNRRAWHQDWYWNSPPRGTIPKSQIAIQESIKTQNLTSFLCLPEVREHTQDHSWRSHAYILAVPFPSWLFTPPLGKLMCFPWSLHWSKPLQDEKPCGDACLGVGTSRNVSCMAQWGSLRTN